MPDSNVSLLIFPCDFPIKAMGEHSADFEALVVTLVRRHAPDLGEGAIRTRESQGGKYISVTATVRATSRSQLDAIYRELTACEAVLVVL
jgi:putative lipoic acid-binding regulatory protein